MARLQRANRLLELSENALKADVEATRRASVAAIDERDDLRAQVAQLRSAGSDGAQPCASASCLAVLVLHGSRAITHRQKQSKQARPAIHTTTINSSLPMR